MNNELLKIAVENLAQSRVLTAGVAALFYNAGDSAIAARLNDIAVRLVDEIAAIERMIAKAGQP